MALGVHQLIDTMAMYDFFIQKAQQFECPIVAGCLFVDFFLWNFENLLKVDSGRANFPLLGGIYDFFYNPTNL